MKKEKSNQVCRVEDLNLFLEISDGFMLGKKYSLEKIEVLYNLYRQSLDKIQNLPEDTIRARKKKKVLKQTFHYVMSSLDKQKKDIGWTTSSVKRKRREEDLDDEPISKMTMELVGKILNQNVGLKYSCDAFLQAHQYLIRHYPVFMQKDILSSAISRMLESEFSLEEKMLFLISISDSLMLKRKRLSKDDKEERIEITKFLKTIKSHLLRLEPFTFVTKEARFNQEVMQYLLENEVPYSYLRQLFLLNPALLEVEEDNQPVIFSVFEHYIESVKEELRNHKKYYIHKEYYYGFFRLLLENQSFPVTPLMLSELTKKKEAFVDYLTGRKYKESRKSEAIEQLDLLFQKKTENPDFLVEQAKDYLQYFHSANVYKQEERVNFTDEHLQNLRKRISCFQDEYYCQHQRYPEDMEIIDALSLSVVDYQNASFGVTPVALTNPYVSYSVMSDRDGSTFFRISVLDLCYYVEEGSSLEQHIFENFCHFPLRKQLPLTGDDIPTITYQVKIHANSKVGHFCAFPSISPVRKKFCDFSHYRDKNLEKNLVSIYRKLSLDTSTSVDGKLLDDFFQNLMGNRIVQFFVQNDFPIILKGRDISEIEYLYSFQNGLGNVFSKMDKKDFQIYRTLLRQLQEETHYANTSFEKGDYQFFHLAPENGIDLFNQRMLLKSTNFSYFSEEKRNLVLKYYSDISTGLVSKANQEIGYSCTENPVVKKK